jgi:hypothetical protein
MSYRIASPKSNPVVAQPIAARILLRDILRKLARILVPGSLPFAIALPTFPSGRLVFSACRAGVCGFVMGNSGQESGAATPGRCRHRSDQDWPPTRSRSAPTLPQRDLCGYAASPTRVFSSPALGARRQDLRVNQEGSPRRDSLPLYTVAQRKLELAMK